MWHYIIVATMNTMTCFPCVLQCCPLPCVSVCLSVWVGVVFRHPTAVRSPHLSLSAQDHPSHSFRQLFCFSSHSTCSPKGLKGLCNKLYSSVSGRFYVRKKIHMIVYFTLGLQSPIHVYFCSATQFIADSWKPLFLLMGGGGDIKVPLNSYCFLTVGAMNGLTLTLQSCSHIDC